MPLSAFKPYRRLTSRVKSQDKERRKQRQHYSAASLVKQLATAKDKADKALDDLRKDRKTLSKTLTKIRQATGWKTHSLDELLVKISSMNTEEISAPKPEAEVGGKKAFFEQVRHLTTGQQRSYQDILAYIVQLHSRLDHELPISQAEDGFREPLLDIQNTVRHIDDFCIASAGMHPHPLNSDTKQENLNNGQP